VEYAIKEKKAPVNRVCRLLKLSRTVYGYSAKKPDDGKIKEALMTIVKKHARRGFKKCFGKLRLDGHTWNHKRVYRVYCELELNLRKKPKKRFPPREKKTLEQPKSVNLTWSMDFMSDALMDGGKFRTLNIIDDFNREALKIVAARSLTSKYVTQYLDEVSQLRGYPSVLRTDNGPEYISHVLKDWAKLHDVELRYIQPGKPAQNAYIERFNRTYREEVLDMYLFKNIEEVQEITNKWLYDYNHERPHESLKNMTPHGYAIKYNYSTNSLY